MHCKEVFKRIRDARLNMKMNKCSCAQSELNFLRHIVKSSDVNVDPDNIKDIVVFHVPENLTELRSFLGLTGYYRRLIKESAKSLAVLLAVNCDKNTFE